MATKPSKNSPIDTLYDQIGGREMCERLSIRFHERVAQDPVLREIFPKNISAIADRFTLFIVERWGGAKEYTPKRGKTSLVCRHAHLPISNVEAERWIENMFESMNEVGIPASAQQPLREFFSDLAPTLTDPFLPLYRLPLDELRTRLEETPELASRSDPRKSLLAEAAGRWDLPRVQLLLDYGAEVDVEDHFGHTPLYRATNAQLPNAQAEGRAVVELLLRYGANLHKPSGSGQSTPLHMTARRDNMALAEALLLAGAEIEVRDTKGETPLRRAVNCGQEGMVTLLLSHGADPLSQDKQGCTPLSVARPPRIRQALEDAITLKRTSS